MGGIASQGQLRMSLLRWAAVTVPLLLLLGFLSGRLVPMGDESAWYAALAKPPLTPPGWVFPIAWGLIYAALGLALAIVLNARGARGRGIATALFVLGFALAFVWSPVFFGAHRIDLALAIVAAMVVVGVATAFAFARVRRGAAWLLVPYLVWCSFAAVITFRLGQLNPDAAGLAPGPRATQML